MTSITHTRGPVIEEEVCYVNIFRCLETWLIISLVLLLSCSISSGALGSHADLLLSYLIITLTNTHKHIIILIIITLTQKWQSFITLLQHHWHSHAKLSKCYFYVYVYVYAYICTFACTYFCLYLCMLVLVLVLVLLVIFDYI